MFKTPNTNQIVENILFQEFIHNNSAVIPKIKTKNLILALPEDSNQIEKYKHILYSHKFLSPLILELAH